MRSAKPGRSILWKGAAWLPLAVAGAVGGGLALGYSLLVLAAFGLLVCVIVCVVVYFQSRKTEREIAAAVNREKRP